MNTLAWVLILGAILIMRAIYKGRLMNIGEDLSDGFLALVSGDDKKFTEVLARTGDSATPTAGIGGSLPGFVGGQFADATVGSYKLGGVKAHVKAAAEKYGPQFGIKDIGGYRAVGSVSNSDHPKGLALDFMVSAKTDKARGDALANALLADPQVTYVIWDKRIHSRDARGWRPYSGGPSDHTDHVHASFKAVV